MTQAGFRSEMARRSPQLRPTGQITLMASSTKRPDVSGSFSSASRRVFWNGPAGRRRTTALLPGFRFLRVFPPLAGMPSRRPDSGRPDLRPLAAAERVIGRVHTGTAIVRLAALPSHSTGLADRNVHVLGVHTGPWSRGT